MAVSPDIRWVVTLIPYENVQFVRVQVFCWVTTSSISILLSLRDESACESGERKSMLPGAVVDGLERIPAYLALAILVVALNEIAM